MILYDEIQKAVARTLETGISQRQLADRIGISDGTLIAIKRGEWDGKVSEAMAAKVQAFFRIDTWNIRDTQNFRVIKKLCEDAQANRRFLGVAGYTGAGKTTALLHFAQDNAGTVFYALATVLHTKRSFLRAIQQAMGLNEGSSLAAMMEAIVTKLIATPNALLVIDDVGKLSDSCLRLLQVIYDATERSTGIVIAGTEFLKIKLDKEVRRKTMGFDELRRRIAYWQPLYRPSNKVVVTIAQHYGITDPNALAFLTSNAKDYGTLREMITNANKKAMEKSIPVTRELLAGLHVGDMAYEAVA